MTKKIYNAYSAMISVIRPTVMVHGPHKPSWNLMLTVMLTVMFIHIPLPSLK